MYYMTVKTTRIDILNAWAKKHDIDFIMCGQPFVFTYQSKSLQMLEHLMEESKKVSARYSPITEEDTLTGHSFEVPIKEEWTTDILSYCASVFDLRVYHRFKYLGVRADEDIQRKINLMASRLLETHVYPFEFYHSMKLAEWRIVEQLAAAWKNIENKCDDRDLWVRLSLETPRIDMHHHKFALVYMLGNPHITIRQDIRTRALLDDRIVVQAGNAFFNPDRKDILESVCRQIYCEAWIAKHRKGLDWMEVVTISRNREELASIEYDLTAGNTVEIERVQTALTKARRSQIADEIEHSYPLLWDYLDNEFRSHVSTRGKHIGE